MTELVYGTTRMKRACDHLVDRFLLGPVDDRVRAALRIGAYQLAFLSTPAHAAVAATVGAVGPVEAGAWSTPCCAGWPTPRSSTPTGPREP